MKIPNSLLRHSLKHVYWITGGPCAGKTTLINKLVNKYKINVLNDVYYEHQLIADPEEFPDLIIPNPGIDWEWFFNRDVKEYARWLRNSANLHFSYLVIELLKTSPEKPILVDHICDLSLIEQVIPKERILCMFAEDHFIREQYLHRPDHDMILQCLLKTVKNPGSAKRNVENSMVEYSRRNEQEAIESGYCYMKRTVETNFDEVLESAVQQFSLS